MPRVITNPEDEEITTIPTIAGGTWTEIGTQTVGSSTVHYYERTA